MAQVEVRQAVVDDARVISEVHVRSWQQAYRGLVPDAMLDALSVDEREKIWRNILAAVDGSLWTLVAEDFEGVLAGFCSVQAPSRDSHAGQLTAEVTAIYVEPSRWRSGVGRLLLDEALGRLRGDGWLEATLWVFAKNHSARAFYASGGFSADAGVEKTHPASGQTEVRLRASLLAT